MLAKLLIIISIIIGLVSIYISSIYSLQELDMPSYMVANLSKLLIRGLYPSNESPKELSEWRKMLETSAKSIDKTHTIKSIYDVDLNGGLSLRIYIPRDNIDDNNDDDQNKKKKRVVMKPILLYFHGGGFVLGSTKGDDGKAITICNQTDNVIVSVEYRLAPENKFPAAIEDGVSALNWLIHGDGINKFGGDKSKIILIGESAGGAIAASVSAVHHSQTLRSESPVNGLILIYPTLDHGIYRDSHFKYNKVNGLLSLEQMIWFWTLYLDEEHRDCHDYRACPLRISDSLLSKFPETLIILAKYDILLDEGLQFNKRLENNGVPSTAIVYNDTIHGFLGIPTLTSQKAYSAIKSKVLELNH